MAGQNRLALIGATFDLLILAHHPCMSCHISHHSVGSGCRPEVMTSLQPVTTNGCAPFVFVYAFIASFSSSISQAVF